MGSSIVTLRGTVYEYTTNWETGQPVPSAIVHLSGNSGAYTTTTDSRGEYTIAGIPDGKYVVVVTAEGYADISALSGSVPIKSVDIKAADNTITTCNMYVYVFPIITKFTPTAGSVIANNPVFTITFNEPMDTSSVRINLVPKGVRASAVGDTVQANLTWSADSREVTVTPNGNLISNEVYRLQLQPPSGFPTMSDPPFDSKGNPIFLFNWWFAAIFDQELRYYADYKTASGGIPGAPAALQVTINNLPTPEVDFVDVISTANKIRLNWTPSTAGSVTGYKIYAAKSGSILNYIPLESDISTDTTTTDNYFTSDISKVIRAFYGDGAEVNPVSTRNYPMVNNSVYFKVVAYNGDGESGGGVVSVRDAVGPKRRVGPNYFIAPYAGGVIGNNFYLPPISEMERAYILTNEPLDASTIDKNFFSLDGGLTVTAATLLTNGDEYAVVEIRANGNLAGRTLTMLSGIKDLSGNGPGSTSNIWGPFI